MLFAAMRIQLSESTYDFLVKCEPKFVITERGLRNVLVSIKFDISVTHLTASCQSSYEKAFERLKPQFSPGPLV